MLSEANLAYRRRNRQKLCDNLRKWRAKNAAKVREYSRQWRAKNPDKVRAIDRRKRGLPVPTRPEPTHCELCGAIPTRRLALDHDHKTGAFRGWLCNGCNGGLGLFRDNPIVLERAADYVRFGGPVNDR